MMDVAVIVVKGDGDPLPDEVTLRVKIAVSDDLETLPIPLALLTSDKCGVGVKSADGVPLPLGEGNVLLVFDPVNDAGTDALADTLVTSESVEAPEVEVVLEPELVGVIDIAAIVDCVGVAVALGVGVTESVFDALVPRTGDADGEMASGDSELEDDGVRLED